MSITSRIKNLAAERKMTIAELERKLEFGSGTISRWDVRNPGIDKIAKVADYFNVSTDYLSGRESYEEMKYAQAQEGYEDTEFVMNYRLSTQDLTKRDREEIDKALQAVMEYYVKHPKDE